MRRPHLGPALLLLLAWLTAPNALRAEEAPEVSERALEGRWDEARQAWRAWREPQPLGRLDLRGHEVELWRPTWTVDGAGRVQGFEDEAWSEFRQAGRRWLKGGQDRREVLSEDFPGLGALRLERLMREVNGMGDLPTGSPLAAVPDPSGTIARFLAWQRLVYHPVPPEQSEDKDWAAQAKSARENAEAHRSDAHRAALLAAGLLLGFTLFVGWRMGRPPRS